MGLKRPWFGDRHPPRRTSGGCVVAGQYDEAYQHCGKAWVLLPGDDVCTAQMRLAAALQIDPSNEMALHCSDRHRITKA